jgi:hypothetical protein
MSEIKNDRPFKIQGIELISYSIQSHAPQEYSKDFVFNVQQEQKTNAEKRLVIIFTKITIKEPKQQISIVTLEVACGFEFPDFEHIFKMKDGSYLISHELNNNLGRISVATCRGILYSQLRGSYLQNSTLPLLPIE